MAKFYKYKGNVDLSNFSSKRLLIRDLQDLEHDKIWASKLEDLNDPSEGLYSIEEYYKNLSIGLSFFAKLRIVKTSKDNSTKMKSAEKRLIEINKNVTGIFSLSRSYNNELMWSHYSNNHRGYCVEYDFDNLKELNLSRV